MLARLRYILPVVVLLGFAGWMYSDDIPKPDLVGAVQNLQQTLLAAPKGNQGSAIVGEGSGQGRQGRTEAEGRSSEHATGHVPGNTRGS